MLEIVLSALLALLLTSLHITEGSPSLPFGLSLLRISAGVFLALLVLEGEILVDGVSPVRFCEWPDVRIAYVGAQPFLIGGTVRENRLYGRSEAFEDTEMIAALRAAQLNHWHENAEDALGPQDQREQRKPFDWPEAAPFPRTCVAFPPESADS